MSSSTYDDFHYVTDSWGCILGPGRVGTGVGHVFRISQKLRIAREEIARLAVTAERLRIARDLHDLLGHNLSLIALKSELAGRLLAIQPERAEREIKDIEQVARTTLQEVREAVSSYRRAILTSELNAAHDILRAAGIAYEFEGDEEVIKDATLAVEATLSWAVREGVTNVIRHSRARHCLIRLTSEKQAISIEIIDNGTASSGGSSNGGNGLRGLAERVMELGGRFAAAPCAGGGFRLAISVPLVPGRNDGAAARMGAHMKSDNAGGKGDKL